MPTSPAFEYACQLLEENSPLNELQARGTIRLALKEGGLEPSSVQKYETSLVIERILPRTLDVMAIDGAEQISQRVLADFQRKDFAAGRIDAPIEVFSRVFDEGS